MRGSQSEETVSCFFAGIVWTEPSFKLRFFGRSLVYSVELFNENSLGLLIFADFTGTASHRGLINISVALWLYEIMSLLIFGFHVIKLGL